MMRKHLSKTIISINEISSFSYVFVALLLYSTSLSILPKNKKFEKHVK